MNQTKIVRIIRAANLTEHTDSLITLAIAYSAELPPAGEPVNQFFRNHVAENACDKICAINELQVLKCSWVEEMVKSCYMHRAESLTFPCTSPDPVMANLPEDAHITVGKLIEEMSNCL